MIFSWWVCCFVVDKIPFLKISRHFEKIGYSVDIYEIFDCNDRSFNNTDLSGKLSNFSRIKFKWLSWFLASVKWVSNDLFLREIFSFIQVELQLAMGAALNGVHLPFSNGHDNLYEDNFHDSFVVIIEIVIMNWIWRSMYRDSFKIGFRLSITYDMKETDFVF